VKNEAVYLHAFLTAVLDGNEWSASWLDRCGIGHGYSTRSPVDLEIRVDAIQRILMPLLGFEGRILGR
jgi:hypothetical protein